MDFLSNNNGDEAKSLFDFFFFVLLWKLCKGFALFRKKNEIW
jgi:hypothetical protein